MYIIKQASALHPLGMAASKAAGLLYNYCEKKIADKPLRLGSAILLLLGLSIHHISGVST